MELANQQKDRAIIRMRAGVGLAGIFVVVCFCAAMFFSIDQSQASVAITDPVDDARLVQASERQ